METFLVSVAIIVAIIPFPLVAFVVLRNVTKDNQKANTSSKKG